MTQWLVGRPRELLASVLISGFFRYAGSLYFMLETENWIDLLRKGSLKESKFHFNVSVISAPP